jgi:hypothetical protein
MDNDTCSILTGVLFMMEVVQYWAGNQFYRRVSEANEVRWVGLRIMSGANTY